MRVLIACEFSGIVRDAFKAKGHDAWSCDLLPTERPGQHYQCDVTEIIYADWDLIIAHPECTYMANSGVRWLYGEDKERVRDRWVQLSYARKFFHTFFDYPVKTTKICIENPIPHKHAKLPPYTQTIQPYEFGHTTSKRTCLWLRGLPELKPTSVIEKEKRTQDIWLAAPSEHRKKDRSRTFEGIANAMAEQWG